MYLKQIRTYILIFIIVSVYGYFLYLPFRRESLSDVIIDYTNTAKTLNVDSSVYGSTLNDLLNENLKLRGLFYNRFRDATDPVDQAWYRKAESETHKIQLELLILLLNHDLYKSTNGAGNGQLSSADCKKLNSLIDSLSVRNAGKADELQKTAFKLMRDKGASVGAIYILAHDMLLLMQMDDSINQTLYEMDLQLLKKKQTELQPVAGTYTGTIYGQIRSSFINDTVDDAVSTLQMAKTMQWKLASSDTVTYALPSFEIPSLLSQPTAAYVKMTGVDNGVKYRTYVYNLFTWDIPDGNYDLEIASDGDFPWQETQQITQTTGITASLTRSDNNLLTVFKPDITSAFQQVGFAMMSFIKLANEPQAVTSYVNLEMAIDSWRTHSPIHADQQYRTEIQPENDINELQQLNDQFYSVLHGLNESEQTKQQQIMNTLSRTIWDRAGTVLPVSKQSSAVKLDYNYIDVEAYTTSPFPTMYVTFAWITPGMKHEAWDVVFQLQNGRYVLVGVDAPHDLEQTQKVGRLFSYKSNNQLPLLKKYLSVNADSFNSIFHSVLPSKVDLSNEKTKSVSDTVVPNKPSP